MKKIVLSMSIFLLFLTGCGKDSYETDEIYDESLDVEQERDDLEEYSNKDMVRQSEIGIYKGKVDSDTVEIETAEGTVLFQMSDDVRRFVGDLKEEEEVIYTYEKEEEQLVLQSIEHYWEHRNHHNNHHPRDERHPHHHRQPMHGDDFRHHHGPHWNEQN